MNYLDISILVLVALFVFNGVRKGLVISLASLIALAVGVYAAIHFSFLLDKWLKPLLNISGTWLHIASFVAMLLLVMLGVMLLGKALEKVVDLAGMGIMNHLAGGLFGLLKGFLVASILIYLITTIDPGYRFIKKDVGGKSMFYSFVEPVFPRLMKVF